MNKFYLLAAMASLLVLTSSAADAQWVFVARKGMGVIHQRQAENMDIATVQLSAPADNVYRAAIKSVSSNPKLKIKNQDDGALSLEFSDGRLFATIKVNRIEDKLSELMISSNSRPQRSDATPIVVDNVLRICKNMNVECKLSDQ